MELLANDAGSALTRIAERLTTTDVASAHDHITTLIHAARARDWRESESALDKSRVAMSRLRGDPRLSEDQQSHVALALETVADLHRLLRGEEPRGLTDRELRLLYNLRDDLVRLRAAVERRQLILPAALRDIASPTAEAPLSPLEKP